MCGIAGFHHVDLPPDERGRVLRRMVAAIEHRGPDGRGFHLDGTVGLGHARLAIVDLDGGAQPMASESADIVFNGEIFNHVELRDELKRRGHRFRTESDTEVILRLYEERGEGCLDALNGDFAFALWDRRRRRLLLARDRMGVRPLYYARVGRGLVFGSEVKALLPFPGLRAEPDPIGLDQIFSLWANIGPRTPFRDIFELPPGHLLVASGDGIAVRPWWRLDFPDAGDRDAHDRRDPAAVAEHLRALLADATRIRLRADVPVAAYLSGGLDSSAVTALAQRIVGAGLQTFSVTFEGAEFDESAHQQAMVAALGTRHRSVPVTAATIGRLFPHLVAHAERPVLRTAPAPMLALSGLVRDSGIKVVLTGEGADEVFAGYDLFREAKLRRFCGRQPGSTRRALLLRRLYPYLPGLQAQPQAYLQAFFGIGADPHDPVFSHLPRFQATARARTFFSEELREAVAGYDPVDELRGSLPERFARWHPLAQAQYVETVHLMPGYILSSQGDRAAMANAVEGRFPFLDHRIVEFATRLPPELKLRGLREKHILREAVRDLVPATINDRPKQPYRAPDSEPFLGPGAPAWVDEILSGAPARACRLFDADAVARLAAKGRRRGGLGTGEGMALVGIVSARLWANRFIETRDRPRREARPTPILAEEVIA